MARTRKADKWPKHADGSPKKFGEMTQAERCSVFQDAITRLEPELAALNIGVKFSGEFRRMTQ